MYFSQCTRSRTSPSKSGTKLFALLVGYDGNSRNLADGYFESLSTTSLLTVLHFSKILLMFFKSEKFAPRSAAIAYFQGLVCRARARKSLFYPGLQLIQL